MEGNYFRRAEQIKKANAGPNRRERRADMKHVGARKSSLTQRARGVRT